MSQTSADFVKLDLLRVGSAESVTSVPKKIAKEKLVFQTTTVKDYRRRFQAAMVKRFFHTNVEAFSSNKISNMFVAGLKPELRAIVNARMQLESAKGQDRLFRAFKIAKQEE